MTFEIYPRRALYIYLKQIRHAPQLKKFGYLSYVSHKMNVAMIYVDDKDIDEQIKKIKQYKFVKKVLMSPRPDIDPDLDNLHDDIFFENYDEESVR
ncbi:YlbG family protein [Leuconostoc palmae]|uniref:YlbG family protein n=1 Tax=Leuconostoc palmae TaxID=501487 RepID=UPI001C7D8D8B|nr:YlbG family protein [Leuconostoc palmae]